MSRTLWLALTLAACRVEDDDKTPEESSLGDDSVPLVVDEDGDGYGDELDCDESDPAVNPGASEQPYDGVDNDCDPATPDDDLDGDGYLQAEDCDESDPRAYPGAVEVCDGRDQDCDGEVDEGEGGLFYPDADGDGYGDPAGGVASCEGVEGYVADASDCDDADAAVNPAADELCDGVDQDCDGEVDEGSAADAEVWYQDADNDGFGDADYTLRACEQPTGYAANDEDCDDGAAAVNPDAAERCDGLDNDCDGRTDPDDATDASTWYGDADGDGYGVSSLTRAACEQPSGWAAATGDCDDADSAVNPGAKEVCDEADNDCDGRTDEGVTSTWYLDYDGDGYGNSARSATACTAPTADYVAVDGDCDDTDSAFSPGATAGCDGEDYDCDGAVDNDADGDGYADITCGGDDCDDSDATVMPEVGGGCAMGGTCKEILDAGLSTGSGEYTVDPDGYGTGVDPMDTWCDMSTEGGGWTLLAKTLKSGLTSTERDTIRKGTWADYTQDGYGDPASTSRLFWLPLEFWHQLTRNYPSNTFWAEDTTYDIRLEDLAIGDSALKYELDYSKKVSGYEDIVSGAVKGQGFTTWDSDNDTWSSNCAVDNVGYNGGFWYTNCYQISMLHADNNLYSWQNNVSTSVSTLYLWFRED